MAKLFALEDDSDSGNKNDSLIDKVLNLSKQEKRSPMNLTADLINQRQDLKKEIQDKLDEEPEIKDDDSSDTDDDSDDNTDNNDDNGENKDNDDNKSKENDDDNKIDSGAADDKDSLNSLVGSGLKSEDKDEKKEEQATESFRTKITLSNIFKPIHDQYKRYTDSMSIYSLESQQLPIDGQPIVYVKDSVIKSLDNLVTLANNYIANNTTFTEKISSSVKNLNERITVFKQFVEAEKFHFTNKLINDKEILSNIAVPKKSDLNETSNILLKYIEDSMKTNALIINNDFNKLSSAYTTANFIKEDEDLVYKTVLPGFNVIRLHIDNYTNYLKTNIQEFQYYKIKTLKTEDLYDLDAVTVSEDNELNRLLTRLDKLLVNIALNTDNLKDINEHFTKFIDEIKVIIFDIEKDKFKDLASIDIDNKVKDFVKFKLVIESIYININLMIEFMTTVMSVLNICIELKD